MINYQDICEEVIEIAKSAGSFIRQEREAFSANKIEFKGKNDLVSYVDKAAESQIIEALKPLIAEAGFIAEENKEIHISDTYNWIVDPLDGTTNFIHGIPAYAVSIALKHLNEIVVGVVYEIGKDECFYGWKDSSAYLNGKIIHVSDNKKVADTLLATGFPYYDFTRKDTYMALFEDLIQNCHGLRRIGAASVDLVYTACGRFDGYFEYNLKPWDIAAGMFIVERAGGEVFDFKGGKDMLEDCDIIATNGYISKELLETVKKYFAKHYTI
ncbi:inositol monophosphatase [Pseudopedobacter saltans DSM 12145]|uniref:Inositol-1-monophosphatase n=1 Tax=Pseudopedobacter saltans (strain ATCC 51119 / DSM 12145 / JCM 21818 / CCUG 39354 / LMG 10337 / NBRC 100064 / NCIMB 13643) TaxID=762903 RepID=F0SAC1_PSESL|nr:inositol monophosphatase family protein [Pseudopedobacter saltans]ADY51498.1 inositol monophosphatase [Pseudopedobacter saltans DSM 12145]